MQDQILDMLLKKDELTWQDILYDLVKSERMSPWDVDVSLLSKRYLEIVRAIKETNFFVSGKVILASAILLKIKSNRLLTENIAKFDNRLFDQNEEEEYIEGLEEEQTQLQPRLTIKTPITRKRKVSIQDLVFALEKALEVDTRRKTRRENYETITENLEIPQKKIDLGEKVKEIYGKVVNFFNTKKGDLTFTQLIPSDSKEDKVFTFVPLLHLENQNKIIMSQQKSFGQININLKQKEVK
jgi:segregation and condensation protein A